MGSATGAPKGRTQTISVLGSWCPEQLTCQFLVSMELKRSTQTQEKSLLLGQAQPPLGAS